MVYKYKGHDYGFNYFINYDDEVTIFSPEGLTKKGKCIAQSKNRGYRVVPVYAWNRILCFERRG